MSPERDDVAIDIEKSLSALSSTTQSKPTIFKVDDHLREVNAKDYEPKIVSIGPIHHRETSHISGMERHKLRLLQELLDERKHLTIDKLVEELRKKEEEARKCYPQSLTNLDNDKFLRMLLLDGCFIIQLTLNYFSGKSKNPVFESEKLIQIIHDLLLFENQLPFAVLDCLFDLIKTGNPDDNLPKLILFLVAGIVPWLDVSKLDSKFIPDHLLGLVYKCISTKIPSKLSSPWYTLVYPKYLLGLIYRLILIIIHLIIPVIKLIVKLIILLYQGKGKKSRAKEKKSPLIHINSASELKEVMGIELKMSEDDSITFAGKVLKFPPLEVSVETESLLRNLMAYEQLQLDDNHQKHVIDYMFFLHCLTRSIKDIEILRYSGIIRNYLGGDKKILEMFNRLGANFMRSSEFTYSDVFERLNRHCANRRNEWTASLRQNYFNSPWSLLSFLAAVLLLLISITQITLAILTYFHKKTVYVVGVPPRT